MEHSTTYVANAVHEHGEGTKEIWRTFWILLVLTLVELALGYWMIDMAHGALRNTIKGSIVILMMAKAFYIVAYFMHLKAEIKNLIMTIMVPLCFLLWGIAAFLYDGNSFKRNRLNYDSYKKEVSKTKVENKAEEKKEEKKPGAVEQ